MFTKLDIFPIEIKFNLVSRATCISCGCAVHFNFVFQFLSNSDLPLSFNLYCGLPSFPIKAPTMPDDSQTNVEKNITIPELTTTSKMVSTELVPVTSNIVSISFTLLHDGLSTILGIVIIENGIVYNVLDYVSRGCCVQGFDYYECQTDDRRIWQHS